MESYIQQQNPWWERSFDVGQMPEVAFGRRFAFSDIEKILQEMKLMIFIRGMRRVGKSTLMKQVIATLLEKNVSPRKIYYVEFSEQFHDLSALLRIVPDDAFFFIDEIQYAKKWRDVLKVSYDTFPNRRVIYSGSAVLGFSEEKESLLGRFMPVDVWPLTYDEYLFLRFSDTDSEKMRSLDSWMEYIRYGEFPELLSVRDADVQRDYIRKSVIDPIITADISLYSVENKEAMSKLIRVLAHGIGMVVNQGVIAREIGVSRVTVKKYLQILEDMRLFEFVPNYYRTPRQSMLSDKKVYCRSLNIVMELFGIQSFDMIGQHAVKGQIVENAVYNELRKKHREIYYWRRKQKELDFIMSDQMRIHAIEVKSSSHVDERRKRKYERYANEASAQDFRLITLGDVPKL
jgi:predicted AAA+ superfamily ATPase